MEQHLEGERVRSQMHPDATFLRISQSWDYLPPGVTVGRLGDAGAGFMKLSCFSAQGVDRRWPRCALCLPPRESSRARSSSSFGPTLAVAVCLFAAADVRAQGAEPEVPAPLATATLLSPTGASASDAAVDSAIHAALERLGAVTVALRPGLDLRAVQLATGCTGESVRCLRAVTSQSGVQILLAPAIERHDQELVLTLLYFDSRNENDLRRVQHTQNGSTIGPETLDAIPDMLRELFRVPAPESIAGADAVAKGDRYARPIPAGPLLLGGAGVLVIGGGAIAGLMMQSTEREYQALPIMTPAGVDAAIHKRSLAKTEGVVANVLYGVGAGAIAIGGLWLALALTHARAETEPYTAVVPLVTSGHLGLSLIHHGPAL